MERLPDDARSGPEAEIDRAARAFHDAVLLAYYAGDDTPRAAALLGNVRTTATEYAHLLARADRDAEQVREAVRAVVWRALAASGRAVDALRPIVAALGPLLDLD
jgi:hypothetical protein